MNIKKICIALMCILVLFVMTGCESQRIKDAKEIIDFLAFHREQVAEYKREIEAAKRIGNDRGAEMSQLLLEGEQNLVDEEYYQAKLDDIYGNCSNGERKQIDAYLKETYHAVIDDYR